MLDKDAKRRPNIILLFAGERPNTPLALLRHGRSYLINYYINIANKMSGNIVVILGDEHYQVKEKIRKGANTHVIVNEFFRETSPAHSAHLGLKRLYGAAYVIYGNADILESMFGLSLDSYVVYQEGSGNQVGIIVQDGIATNFSYGLPQEWSGFLHLSEKDTTLFKEICQNKMLMLEVLNNMIDKGCTIKAFNLEDIK